MGGHCKVNREGSDLAGAQNLHLNLDITSHMQTLVNDFPGVTGGDKAFPVQTSGGYGFQVACGFTRGASGEAFRVGYNPRRV